MKVTSTLFLLREVEQLAVYQLLPNFAISSSGSEPEHVMTSVKHLIKSRALATIAIFSVIISIDLITVLASVVYCISLLPAGNVEMRVKRQLF